MKSCVFFIILISLSKIFTCCHLRISRNNFWQTWRALQSNHTSKSFLVVAGTLQREGENRSDLRHGTAVQEFVESDRSPVGLCRVEPVCIVNAD